MPFLLRQSCFAVSAMTLACGSPPQWPAGTPAMAVSVRVDSPVPVAIREQTLARSRDGAMWEKPVAACETPCVDGSVLAGPDKDWWIEGRDFASQRFTFVPVPEANLTVDPGAPTLFRTGIGFAVGGGLTMLVGTLLVSLESEVGEPGAPLSEVFWTGIAFDITGLVASGVGLIMIAVGESTITIEQQGSIQTARAPRWYLGEF